MKKIPEAGAEKPSAEEADMDISDDELSEMLDAVVNKKSIKGMRFLGAIVGADCEHRRAIKHGIPTREPRGLKARPPKNVALSRAVANYLTGRECIYKDRNYIGPVLVDFASASYRWIQISCITRPWMTGKEGRKFSLVIPVNGVRANRFCIHASGGYGVGGMFIHETAAIEAIEKLYRSGAGPQAVIDAINFARGLPDEVAMLEDLPFEPPAH
jgi:hypothetical protein